MKIYQEIAKNTTMGIEAINSIRKYTEDAALKLKLNQQRESLKAVREKALESLGAGKAKEAEVGAFKKAMLKMGVTMNTLVDKSTHNIAEMLIEGSNMGINNVQKIVNDLKKNNEEAPPLIGELMKLYNKNITQLREFL